MSEANRETLHLKSARPLFADFDPAVRSIGRGFVVAGQAAVEHEPVVVPLDRPRFGMG